MREILFRGKLEDNNSFHYVDWCYGSLVYSPSEDQYYIAEHCDEECSFPVDRETIGQYTGLTDKNGTKIFEGDIVEPSKVEDDLEGYSPLVVSKFKGEVFFDEFTSKYQIVQKIYIEEDNSYEYEQYDLLYGTDEVIGNIYDNPELLEVAKGVIYG